MLRMREPTASMTVSVTNTNVNNGSTSVRQKLSDEDAIAEAKGNITRMVVLMVVLSITVHNIYTVSAFFSNFARAQYPMISNYLWLAVNVSLSFKTTVNFFIFYSFNKNFRKVFLGLLKKGA